jgi:hypothetical protein
MKDLDNPVVQENVGKPSKRDLFADRNKDIELTVRKLDTVYFTVFCAQAGRLGIAAYHFSA